jgi:hypothetical protein
LGGLLPLPLPEGFPVVLGAFAGLESDFAIKFTFKMCPLTASGVAINTFAISVPKQILFYQ